MPLTPIIRPVRHCVNCDFRSMRMLCSLDEEALADFDLIGVS